MAHRKKKRRGETGEEKPKRAWHSDLHPETKKSALAIFAFMAAALLAISYVGKGGNVGNGIYRGLGWLLGGGYFFAPLSFILIGFSLMFSEKRKILAASLLGGILFLLTSLTGLQILLGKETGGAIGGFFGSLLLKAFDFWAGLIMTVGFFVISLLFMFNIPLWRRSVKEEGEEEEETIRQPANQEIPEVAKVLSEIGSAVKNIAAPTPLPLEQSRAESDFPVVRKLAKKFDYKKPPLELLQGDRGTPSSGDIKANANIIKRTLENFGIEVDMSEVSVGPTVTQYTLKPAEGVKLSRIVALHNDLSLALASHPIRIEAPIPGKSLVGVEVPNRSIALVGLRSLLEHKIFQESPNPLLFALGRDVTGGPVFADLARMPHLLISGATGSGKSVAAHSIMTSFIFRNPPEVLRFIIVDPKRV